MNTHALQLQNRKTWRTALSQTLFHSALTLSAAAAVFGIVLVKAKNAGDFAAEPLLLAYTYFVTAFQISRLVSTLFYTRSYEKVLRGARSEFYEPTVTFVVPCKNEEKAIRKTVSMCFAANYPKEKIEVIVINDGSTDGTIGVLRRMQQKYINLVVVDWKINMGKRHGMAEGFRRAKGEIVVQLDSDSYFEPSSFRELIKPFANPEIGAVCAHADPENADKNTLTRMQAAYYYMSFRVLKAAESTYCTVFCCSGCSSAYRKDIVLPLLDDFLEEKFLGRPVTWGDDRALTNRVLKEGHKTIYTDRAKAFTIVPENLKQLLTQQVRWKKGWFVNSIFALKFIVRTNPFVAFTYFIPLIIVTVLTPFMAARALAYTIAVQNPLSIWFYFFGILLVTALIAIYYRYTSRENKYWPYLFAWAGLNTILLSFLMFYALATIQNRKWGTR